MKAVRTDVCKAQKGSRWSTCGCERCMAKRRRVDKLRRAGRLVPARNEEAWAVIDRLTLDGWLPCEIAAMAGLGRTIIAKAQEDRRHGNLRGFVPYSAEAIIRAGLIADTRQPKYRLGIGSARRLRALARMGWSIPALTEHTGLSHAILTGLRRHEQVHVLRDKDAAVRAAYDRLWNVDGGDNCAKTCAQRNGWAAPLDWDDEPGEHYIDDPDARPYNAAAEAPPRVDLDELLAAVARGTTERTMADYFGVRPDSLYTALRRKGHHEAADRLAAWSGRAVLPHLRKNA